MALERVGIGGILKFSADAAIGNMKRAGVAFNNLQGRAARVGSGMSKLGGGVAAGSLAMAGVSAGVGVAAGAAANFEEQMSVVNSIMDKTNRERLPELTDLAKKMGATTSFSATQAGQGIEAMARAGANAQDIMDGLGGVLNAAAADGIDLGSATTIVSTIVKSMGLTFNDATRVADVLAKTSSKTNTDITGLGDSFRYAAAQSKSMGIDLETTAAALGAVADSLGKGSIGGTSFSNMLVKMTKPSKEASKFMSKYGIKITDATGKMRDIFDITQDFSNVLGRIKDDGQRARMETEVFGVRGKKAFSALATALKDPSKNLRDLREQLKNASGSAKEMAELRLDNVIGAFTLFRSATEGLFIEVFGPMLPFVKKGIQDVTNAVSGVVQGLQLLKKPGTESRKEFMKLGTTTRAVAEGINDAIAFINNGWKKLVNAFQEGQSFIKNKLGFVGIRTFSKWAVIFSIVTAAITPVVLAFGAIAFVISSAVIPVVSGLISILSAVAGPILLIAAIGIAAWKAYGQEIVTFIAGLKMGLMPILGALKEIWIQLLDDVKVAWDSIVFAWTGGTQSMAGNWEEFGRVVGVVLLTILTTAVDVIHIAIMAFTGLVTGAIAIGKAIWSFVNAPLKFMLDFILNLQDAWGDLITGNILRGITKIGLAIIDNILIPFRALIRAGVKFGKAIGFNVPDSLARFAEQGFTGLAFGRDNVGAVPDQQAPPSAPGKRASPAAEAAARAEKRSKESDKTAKELAEAIKKLPEKQKIEIKNDVCLDGREISIASEKHKVELKDRAGFKATPWQRRMAVEAGGVPVASAG